MTDKEGVGGLYSENTLHVHKMLSQGSFCKILIFVIGYVIK
jgi:hypothetical protein